MGQDKQSGFGLLTEYDIKEAVEKGLESVKGKWHEPDTVQMAVLYRIQDAQRKAEENARWQAMLEQLPNDLKQAMQDHRNRLDDLERRQGETYKCAQASYSSFIFLGWMLCRILLTPALCKAMGLDVENELKQLLHNLAKNFDKEKDWIKS